MTGARLGWDWVDGRSGADRRFVDLLPADRCSSGHFSTCPFVVRENDRGGEARGVVLQVATALGLDLSARMLGGDIWSEQNMARVVPVVRQLVREHRNQLAELAHLRQQVAKPAITVQGNVNSLAHTALATSVLRRSM